MLTLKNRLLNFGKIKRNTFMIEGHGFQTGDVLLPGLDIIVKLKARQYFRNDGLVKSIRGHLDEIEGEFGTSDPYDMGNFSNVVGKCSFVEPYNCKGAIIFMKPSVNVPISFLLGHESTHALKFFGLEDCLIEALKSEGFGLNQFPENYTEENIADIGGLLAAYKDGGFREIPHYSNVPHKLTDDLNNSRK